MAWIDIVFIAVILLFAVIGLWKGLFDSILSLCASVASVFLAFWAGKPVAEFLNRTAGTNAFFRNLLTKWNVPTSEVFSLEELASVCSLVLSMIIVFILIKAAVWLLAKLFDSVTAKSTPLSGMNRLLGLVFGAIQGFAVVLVLLGLTSIASTVSVVDTKVNNFLESSKLTRHTYVYVDEWVEDNLQDKIEGFIKDLAKNGPKDEDPAPTINDYLDMATESLTSAQQAQTATTEITVTVPATYEKDGVTITIEYVSVTVKQGDTDVAGAQVGELHEGKVVVSGLTAGTEYKVTLTVILKYRDEETSLPNSSTDPISVVLTLSTLAE